MPRESYDAFNESFQPNHDSDDILTNIYATAEEVDAKIEDLTRAQNFAGPNEQITLRAQASQLRTLSQLVLGMAENNSSIIIDVDNDPARTDAPHWFRGSHREKESEAMRQGKNKGTLDLLTILAPDTITDEVHRTLLYRAWEREDMDRIIKNNHLQDFLSSSIYLDGALHVTLQTRIDTVVVDIFYGPDSKAPRRTIRAKYKGERSDFTLPS